MQFSLYFYYIWVLFETQCCKYKYKMIKIRTAVVKQKSYKPSIEFPLSILLKLTYKNPQIHSTPIKRH